MQADKIAHRAQTNSRHAKILSSLGKKRNFVDAYKTELGQELLNDCLSQMEYILEMIIQEKATAQQLAEFRVLRNIVNKWTDRIIDFIKDSKEIHGLGRNDPK